MALRIRHGSADSSIQGNSDATAVRRLMLFSRVCSSFRHGYHVFAGGADLLHCAQSIIALGELPKSTHRCGTAAQ